MSRAFFTLIPLLFLAEIASSVVALERGKVNAQSVPLIVLRAIATGCSVLNITFLYSKMFFCIDAWLMPCCLMYWVSES